MLIYLWGAIQNEVLGKQLFGCGQVEFWAQRAEVAGEVWYARALWCGLAVWCVRAVRGAGKFS